MPLHTRLTVLSVLAAFLAAPVSGMPSALSVEGEKTSSNVGPASSSYCEDFAKRQVKLANRQLERSNYTRALKVLNSTAENCNRDFVREKLAEVFGAWFQSVRSQGPSALQQYLNVLSDQSYLTSSQQNRLDQRVQSYVRSLIEQEFEAEQYRDVYQRCRTYPQYADAHFESEYYCGTAALEVGAERTAMSAYAWLIDNWSNDQSLTSWEELSSTLEELYFANGRFREAYDLAQQMAVRDPTPRTILSSLISVRGNFLSPVVRVGSVFYRDPPSNDAANLVGTEMQRVSFPEYVRAFYVLTGDGTVERGMYGSEATQPSTSLLTEASGSVTLLQSTDQQNLAWLVSPIGDRYLVLEFGVATTPEENVRLETVQKNVESDAQWDKLYDLEFSKTSPASGSAIGTILGGASTAGADFTPYNAAFDDSAVLTYHCIQDQSGDIQESYNFDRSNLGYGEDEWQNTSTTPALYHHDVQYGGQSLREVVWPKFVDDNWTGVIRIGLAHS